MKTIVWTAYGLPDVLQLTGQFDSTQQPCYTFIAA